MKKTAKAIAGVLALVLILPCWLGFLFSSLLLGRRKAFPGWSQAMSLLPGLCGVHFHRAFYHMVLPRMRCRFLPEFRRDLFASLGGDWPQCLRGSILLHR